MADVTRRDLTWMSKDTRIWSAATIFARAALAAAFLSALADRFGLWGQPGTNQVFWGDFETFTQYVHTLAPYLPARLVTAVACGATAVEILLSSALLLGVKLRWAALGSAATLVVFALSMFFFAGFETPLSASVFSAAAAALLLALAPPGSYAASLDHLYESRTKERGSKKRD
ncbi:DoxX family protein [Mycobacterium sp. ACS1612]|uniref:DoxX family protein n=1 Tax=Mycobacterium sp. ACS1612 TaxID=1834117 RepID=UPI000AA93E89|nr:DoxX family protein [Mycobacterium sp. ACS1612]